MDRRIGQEVSQLRVTRIVEEADDTKTFVLESLDGQPVPYLPGQFLTFVFQTAQGKHERRNYSLSSIPGEPTTITIKRIPNGEFSRYMIDRFREGGVLTTIGASGFFILPTDVNTYPQYVFFAAGSGITPVFSLVKTLLRNHSQPSVLLVYSNRNARSTIFRKQLDELQHQYPDRFHIEYLHSDAGHIRRKRLGIYVIHEILRDFVKTSIDKPIFYLCGPFEYMRMISIVLLSSGVPSPHIRKEIFLIEKPSPKALPPDTNPHLVTVEMGGRSHSFTVQYPDTILQTAKRNHVALPFSCEAGQCGACSATCISGEVWMSHNDVLVEEEVNRGRILTCTGYPVHGDVYLKI